MTLFENVLLEIDRGYVEPVDDRRLFETAVKAMLDTLDPYTEFEGEQLAKVDGYGLCVLCRCVLTGVVDGRHTTESVHHTTFKNNQPTSRPTANHTLEPPSQTKSNQITTQSNQPPPPHPKTQPK